MVHGRVGGWVGGRGEVGEGRAHVFLKKDKKRQKKHQGSVHNQQRFFLLYQLALFHLDQSLEDLSEERGPDPTLDRLLKEVVEGVRGGEAEQALAAAGPAPAAAGGRG